MKETITLNENDKKRYDEIIIRLKEIDEYLDTEDFKKLSDSDKRDYIAYYLDIKNEQNSIIKLSSRERLKLKMIKKFLGDLNELEKIKLKSLVAYTRMRETIRNKILSRLKR